MARRFGNLGVEELEGFESVRLFLERARYRRPDFELDDRDAASVVATASGA